MNTEIKQKNSGITLIALIITIIVMLILAGIGISVTTGIIDKATYSAFVSEMSNLEESVNMYIMEKNMETAETGVEQEKVFQTELTSSDLNDLPDELKQEIQYVRDKINNAGSEKSSAAEYTASELNSTDDLFFVDSSIAEGKEKAYVYDEQSKSVYKAKPTIISGKAMFGYDYGKIIGVQGLLKNVVQEPAEEKKNGLKIALGAYQIAIIDVYGNIWTAGQNTSGQLGDGKTANRINLQQITTGTKYTEIYAGSNFFIAKDENNNIWSWGANESGQCGTGDTANVLTPTKIIDNASFEKIQLGDFHVLALDKQGNIWGWGANGSGQLATGDTNNVLTPTQITTGKKYIDIDGNNANSFVIDENGILWGCGMQGQNGEIGNGTTYDKNGLLEPQTSFIQIKENIKDIICGRQHSIAIEKDGKIWGWGNNKYGQFGNGSNTQKNGTPLEIQYDIEFEKIVSGYCYRTNGIDKQGNIWSWGRNAGYELGDGTETNRNRPVQITTGTKFIDVFNGYQSTIAIDETGEIWGWGVNSSGELGNNSTSPVTTPTKIDWETLWGIEM